MSAWRESARLALPLILSNISVPLLGIVDTAVVGHLEGPQHLGAVALGSTILSAFFFLFGFLRMGTTALAAQALGADDPAELRASLVRGLLVGIGAGFVLLLLTPLLVPLAIRIFSPAAEIEPGLRAYVAIRLLAAPAALGSLALWGWMLGMQDARGPLLLMLVTNALNAGLDILMVFGLGLAAAGVAAATAMAEVAGLLVGLALVRQRWRRLGGGLPLRAEILAAPALRRLFAINRDIFLRSLFLESAMVVFAALGSRQGELLLAANAVLLSFLSFAAYGLDGFAFAAEAMVGRAVGARDRLRLRRAVRAGLGNAGLLALLLTLAFWALGPTLVRLITDIPEVRAEAFVYLPWVIALPAVAVWAYVFDGVFFGATRTGELRNAMAVSLAAFLLLAFWLTASYGNHGLWLAMNAFLLLRGLLLAALYRRRPMAVMAHG